MRVRFPLAYRLTLLNTWCFITVPSGARTKASPILAEQESSGESEDDYRQARKVVKKRRPRARKDDGGAEGRPAARKRKRGPAKDEIDLSQLPPEEGTSASPHAASQYCMSHVMAPRLQLKRSSSTCKSRRF